MFSLRPFVLAAVAVFLALVGHASTCAQTTGCEAPDWSPTVAYQRGDSVTHVSHEWIAKRNSQGVVPGTHTPTWRDLGSCAVQPPPPDDPPPPPPPRDATPIAIFGVWHAGNHYADWALVRAMGEFDQANHWIIDRGDGVPSVNLVVLSFLHPIEVLAMQDPVDGVPPGMTMDVVNYFKSAGIRVMMSIGGVTYIDAWDEALALDAERLAVNAAAIASHFGVGIEIDYERNVGANLEALDVFVDTYRSIHPYDASGATPAARLTIDLAAGGRYLQELNRYATEHWLRNDAPVLDYANAMVHRQSGSPENWQEHVTGMPTYDPVIPPKAPNRFTGGLYLKGNTANCLDFFASEQWQHADYVQTVAPAGAGATNGMLGYMFWAAEYPSARKNYVGTVPPNTCEGGMGVAAQVFELPIPMEPLRQQ